MKRTENIKIKPLKAGRIEWHPKVIVGVDWYRIGHYTSPRGVCIVEQYQKRVLITAVAGGETHCVTIEGIITPTGVAHRCCKLLKSLAQ